MSISKIQFDGNTLIDLTQDTVTAAKLHSGYTAHDASGDIITGSYEPPSGSINIQTNGTYDITDKTSAVVNVSTSNAKCFTKTFDTDQSSTHVEFNPPDDDIARHYTDNTFIVGFIATFSTSDTSTRASFVGANTMHTGNSAYGMYLRSSTAGVSGQLVQKLVTAPQAQTIGTITVDSRGVISAYASSSYPIRKGTYIVVCGW